MASDGLKFSFMSHLAANKSCQLVSTTISQDKSVSYFSRTWIIALTSCKFKDKLEIKSLLITIYCLIWKQKWKHWKSFIKASKSFKEINLTFKVVFSKNNVGHRIAATAKLRLCCKFKKKHGIYVIKKFVAKASCLLLTFVLFHHI